MQTYYSRTCVFIFILVSTSIGCSSACPPGCNCRGSPEKRDTAVCYKSWPYTHKPVEFNEPITSIEFRQLLFQDMEPYLEAVHDVTNVIIYPPMKSSDDNPVPDDLFKNVENLKALTIHPTLDRLAPAGLGKAIQPLTNLKTLDFVGNTIHCDCTLPKTIASQNILLLSKSRMPAVKECKRHGFPTDLYNIHDFLEKCAERGGYELDEPSNDIVPQVQAGLSNRRFGNIRDQKLFKAGIKHTRINSNPMKPSAAKRVPGAFSGALGKPRSRNLRLREPGAKRVLLPGGLSAFARKKPTFSANKFASRYSKARRWGRRRLLSLDEVDIDPAFSEVIATAQGEEKRQKRRATTLNKTRRRKFMKKYFGNFLNAYKKRGRGGRRQKNKNRRGRRRLLSLDEVDIDPAFSEVVTAQDEEKRQKRQATTRKKKRRRRPVKILPGMSMEDFINAHKKRGRGRRRRKNKNGWTRLSGGWRYREIRSVGGENNSDSYFPLELPVPPNGQSQQKSEEDSQEVSLGSKRSRWGRRRLLSLDEVDIDPAFSEVIATAQGEEKRQKRQATTRKKKRRRRPVKILPGMSMEDFINAHKKRGRGRRRRKNKNGWTRLSGGWRYREIRSVGGENNSDSYFPLELPVPPNGQSQQKSEEDSQEVSLRSKRNIVRNDLISMLGRLRQRKGAQRFQKQNLWADQYLSGQRRRGERSANGQNDNNILEDVLSISNRTGYPLRGDTSNQSPTDDAEQQNVNRNVEESRGKPTDAVQLGRPVPPPVYANPRRRPHAHPPGQGLDHHRRHLQGKIARQLAMYQLPINDLTVKLNPFDPFEVDLFFQYILHNENLPSIGSYRTLNDENKL